MASSATKSNKGSCSTTQGVVAVGAGLAVVAGSFLAGRYLAPSHRARKKGKHTYQLKYFAIRGRGEVSRLLFHAAEVDFKDICFPITASFEKTEMQEDKRVNPELYPWGQLPTLEVDGKVLLSQSHAIERYLARQFDLMGATDIEEAQCDSVIEAMDDFYDSWRNVYFNVADDKKKSAWINHYERFDKTFTKLVDMLDESSSGFLLPSGLSVADLSVYQWIYTMAIEDIMQAVYENHPELDRHRRKIEAIPSIERYLNTRPKYFF